MTQIWEWTEAISQDHILAVLCPREVPPSSLCHPLKYWSIEKSCGRILISLDDIPNSVAKRVICIDWQPLLGSFTWKNYVPKYVTVLCKATNVLSTPSSIIFWTRTHSHEHILKTYLSGIPPHHKLHSPITAFSHPTFISTPLSLIHTFNLIFTFTQDSGLQSLAHFCIVPGSSQLYFLPYPVWTTGSHIWSDWESV